MKIAHISDLHICISHKKNNIQMTTDILNYLANSDFDHLVITGDISDNSQPEDYKLLRAMLKNFGFLDPKKLSLVIGNHDIFGTVQKIEDIAAFPKKCMNIKYHRKISEFCECFYEAFEDTERPSKKGYFPFAKVLGNNLLIGLNSVQKYSRLKNPFASNGKVSNEQINDLLYLFKKEKYQKLRKIVLVHHHFYKEKIKSPGFNQVVWHNLERFTMKLRKKGKLLKIFRKFKVQLVLHGHLHESKEYWRDNIRFSNAGLTLDSKNGFKINVLKIDENIKTRILEISYNSNREDQLQKIECYPEPFEEEFAY